MQRGRREQDASQDLSPLEHVSPRCGAERFRGHLARAAGAGDPARRLEGDQGRDRVRGGRGVAEIPPHACPALDLPSAHDPRGIGQRRVGRRNLRVLVDPVAGNRGSEPEPLDRAVGQLGQLRDLLDVHDEVGISQMLAQLNQQVCPPRQQPCRAMGLRQQGGGLGQRAGAA